MLNLQHVLHQAITNAIPGTNVSHHGIIVTGNKSVRFFEVKGGILREVTERFQGKLNINIKDN